MNLMRGIDLRKIAQGMHEASGAETKAVCTEAGMFALRERRVHVTQDDFEMAVAKVRVFTWLVEPCMARCFSDFLSSPCAWVQVMKKDSEKNMSLKKLWK